MQNTFTLEEILNIAAHDIRVHAMLLMQVKVPAHDANQLNHRRYMLNQSVRLMMMRIHWHLLQLSPGPDTYKVTNAS